MNGELDRIEGVDMEPNRTFGLWQSEYRWRRV